MMARTASALFVAAVSMIVSQIPGQVNEQI
jgi:hypothetical protein